MATIKVGELLAPRAPTVDPTRHPDEVFALYSIPAFDRGTPDTVAGRDIGSPKQQVVPGDVLLSKIVPHIRRAGVVRADGGRRLLASSEWIVFNADHVDPRYLSLVLVSDSFHREYMTTVGGVGGSLLRAQRDQVAQIVIPLPHLDEQREIADVLESVRASMTLELSAISNAERVKADSVRHLIMHGLRGEPLKDSEIGAIPESWRLQTLADVALLERGRFTHRPRNDPRFYGGNTPFVQTGDVVRSAGHIREYSQTLNDDGVAISRIFPAGTILITIAANIGYTGVLEFDSACPDSVVAISPADNIDVWFLEYFLETQQLEMDRQAPKGTQKNINIQFLKPWPVPVPPITEQRKIAEVLSAIDRKSGLHKRKRAILAAIFNALLDRLMTGEIRVSDLDIAAVDALAGEVRTEAAV